MHSGRDAEVPPASTAAAAATRIAVAVRRLPPSALRLVAALLAMAILALSLIGGCAAEPSAEPTVRSFLLAWEQGRYWDAAAYTTGARSSVAAALRGEYRQLGAAALFLNLGPIGVHGNHAEAHFYASVDLGQDGAPWRYEGEFTLRRVGGNWKIEWRPSVINPNLRRGLRLAVITSVPKRAPVLDASGRPLVRRSPVYVLGVQPDRLRQPRATATAFASATGLDAGQVLTEIRSAQPHRFQELLTLSPASYARLQRRLNRIAGLQLRVAYRRLFSTAARGIVGSVVTENSTLLREEGLPYQPGITLGRSGLQQVYQHRLAGTPTTRVVVENTHGSVVAVLKEWPGQQPAPVRTTISARVQAAAAGAVRSAPGGAAIVAVQASTGHILAISHRSGNGESMVDAPLRGHFPPGDAFTIVSSAALLNAGFAINAQIPCTYAKDVGGETFTNDQSVRGIGAQPPFRVDFARGCGTAFAGLSRLLNGKQLTSAAARFGIGARYQLPLPAFTGRVPPPRSDAELAADMIGEGRVRVSPLDMALVAAEVRSGTWHRPILVTEPPDPANVPVTPFAPQLMNALKNLMRAAVTSGAAQAADLPGLPVFGQAGSAPTTTRGGKTSANWFVGFRGGMAFAVLTLGNPVGANAVPVAAEFLRAAEG